MPVRHAASGSRTWRRASSPRLAEAVRAGGPTRACTTRTPSRDRSLSCGQPRCADRYARPGPRSGQAPLCVSRPARGAPQAWQQRAHTSARRPWAACCLSYGPQKSAPQAPLWKLHCAKAAHFVVDLGGLDLENRPLQGCERPVATSKIDLRGGAEAGRFIENGVMRGCGGRFGVGKWAIPTRARAG